MNLDACMNSNILRFFNLCHWFHNICLLFLLGGGGKGGVFVRRVWYAVGFFYTSPLSLSLSPFCKISMCELRFISAGFFLKNNSSR